MTCPANEKLELLFEEALPATETAELRAHVLLCERCEAYRRKLEEEGKALAQKLPDLAAPEGLARIEPPAPASNAWKFTALLSAAAALVMALTALWVSRRNDELEALRNNVLTSVRREVAKGDAAAAVEALKAMPDDALSRAAGDAARMDIASKAAPELAARLLDEVTLAGKDPATAASVARARLAVYEQLFEQKVLVGGRIPAPFEHDGYRWEKETFAPREEMSRVCARLLDCDRVVRDSGAGASRFAGLASIARYALDEIPYGEVKPATAEERYAFGDLLFRERQFDRAIEAWKPMIDDARVYRKLAELAALRRFAPKTLHVWDYEVESLLGSHPEIDKEATAHVEGLFRRARPGVLPVDAQRIVEDRHRVEDPIFDPRRIEAEIADDPDQLYLLVEHRGFRLSVGTNRPFTTRGGAKVMLTSDYAGPIRYRLLRAKSVETFKAVDESTLIARRGELTPVAEWEKATAPIWAGVKQLTDVVEVPHKGAGLFVLIADARYCPVLAVAKFIVTDATLVQQVALDRVLIFAADRVSGAPIEGLALAGEVKGSYVLRPEDLLPSDDSNAAEFRRGFESARAAAKAEPDASAAYLRGYQRAVDLKNDRPDVSFAFQGRTGRDGLFEWSVASPWRAGYRYFVLTTTAEAETYSRVSSEYTPDGASSARDLVYTDRPIYRPGDKVHFKAMLRRLDNEGLQAWDRKQALVEFGVARRTIFSKSVEVTDFGTAGGSFDLPYDVEQGWSWVRVDNGAQRIVCKIEEYRKPDFEVAMAHDRRIAAGKVATVEIAVRMYSGDPVAHTKVNVEIHAAPIPGRSAASSVADEWISGERTPIDWRVVEAKTLTTDEAGRCTLRFVTDAGIAAQYYIRAGAIDVTRREVLATTTLEATTSLPTGLSIETDRPMYAPGEVAKLRIRVEGATAVRVEEQKADLEKRFAMTVALERGIAVVSYTVPETANDLAVGVRSGDEWLWTPAKLKIAARVADGALAVRLNKAIYRVGETAKISIRTAENDQHVLVEIGTGRIHERRVVSVAERETVIDVPVTEAHVPNVAVVALAIRGDQLRKATADLRVPPGDRFLTVEIETDKAEYRPAEECRATVRVIDSQGRPVRDCEISLGVVDEAVYSLEVDRTPDLREYFHRYERKLAFTESCFFEERSGSFIVWKAPTFVRGLRSLYDAIGGGGGSGGRYGGRLGGKSNLVSRGGGSAGPSSPPRADFRDAAYWEAHLRTNADGIATATFAFPENLTTFRFTAHGITRDTKVGSVRHRAVVRKSFYTRLAAPRLLQEGNTVEIAALVHNGTTEPQQVKVDFKSSYPVVKSTATESILVAPGGVEKVEYLVSVDRFLHDAKATFRARSESGLEDGVELILPGRRHGAPHSDGRSGTVSAAEPREEVFRVPEGAIRGTLALKLNLDAGVHAAVIEGLEPLIEYPYGCIEQTMSRFFPAAVADRALGQTDHRWKGKLPSVVASGLQRVYSMQQSDGSWGWFRGEGTNHGMTAYALYGLALCKQAGVGVDRTVSDRAAQFLRTRIAETKGRVSMARQPLPADVDERVYEVLALAEYEATWGGPTLATRRLAGTLATRDDERSAIDDVMLALALHRLGLTEEAGRIAKRSEGRKLDDVATAAFVLQLRLISGGDASEAMRFLLSQRTGKGWRTTIESAYAILGLAAMIDRAKPGDYATPGQVTVEVNGTVVKSVELPSGVDPKFDGRISVMEPDGGWGQKIVVRLTFGGRGTASYSASLTGLLGGEERPAVSRGIEVSREYFEFADGGWRSVEGQILAGRQVLVKLRVRSAEKRSFVMVTDPRPDGFEPSEGAPGASGRRTIVSGLSAKVDVVDGWQARLEQFRRMARGDAALESEWARALLLEILEKRRFSAEGREEEMTLPTAHTATVEHRDDRTIVFATSIPAGESHFYYVVRAETAGELHALAPRAEPMYEPEVFGSGVETRLRVVDERVVGSGRASERPLAWGVAGLRPVILALESVDADVVMGLVADRRELPEIVAAIAGEKAVEAWLKGTTPCSGGLRDRIEAARADLATRERFARSVRDPKWLAHLEAALKAAPRVLEGPVGGEVVDNAALYVAEERDYRCALIEAIQSLKGSSRIDVTAVPSASIDGVLAAMGAAAPKGEAIVEWKLLQQVELSAESLRELAERLERDLRMTVKLLREPKEWKETRFAGTVERVIDAAAKQAGLFFKVSEGCVVIGTTADLMK